MIRKLKSSSGESIAETLVAVLIAALALLMLAGTINSASRLITTSKSALETYYHENNAMADYDGSPTCSVTVTGSEISNSWDSVPYHQLSGSSMIGSKTIIAFG